MNDATYRVTLKLAEPAPDGGGLGRYTLSCEQGDLK